MIGLRTFLPGVAPALAPVALLAAALACGGPAGGDDAAAHGRSLEATTLLVTNNACLGEERREELLSTAAAWTAWHREASCRSGAAAKAVPTGSVVLAVSDVLGPSGCHAVRIAGVEVHEDGSLHVLVRRHVPRRGQACTAQVVHPAHAVAVRAKPGPVAWTWETVEGPPPSPAS